MAQSAKGLLKPFWKHWPAILIYFVVVAAAYWSIETPNGLRIAAVLAIPYGMIVAFLTLFTGDDISVPRMVQFCYAFTIFAALAVALPLVLFPFWPNLDEKMRGAPVGILLGCVQLEGKEKSELNCNETATAQWVINIGGAVGGEYHPSQPAPVAEETPSATLTAGVEETPTTESVEETPTAEGAEGSPTPEQPTPEPTPTREQTQVAEPIPTSKDSAGGEAWRPVEISGGLVVPVYFVLIAVIGAVVSMIRRVPEYQRRAGLGYAEHYAKLPDPRPVSRAPISAAAAREYLVFQIMQVVSAPLIAIVAYQLIDSTELATSVTLAFVSGFASETVLLLIRGATDKLAPAKVAEEPTNLPSRS